MKNNKLSFGILGIIMITGFCSWIYQLLNGLSVTHMSNSFSWGLYIAGFAFFVGNAAGGMVLSSSIYMLGLYELKPYAKLGAITAIANVLAAMIVIVVDLGRPERMLNMILHPNFESPIIWDVIILSSYAILSIIYLYILLLPDLTEIINKTTMHTDRVKLTFLSKILKNIAKKSDSQKIHSDKWAKKISPIALVFAVGIHVVTSWIFATQGSRDWWHTAILSPDFISVAVLAGTAVVLSFAVYFYGKTKETTNAYKTMIKFMFVAFCLHMFFMYNEFFIKLWSGSAIFVEPILITIRHYWYLHAFEVIAPLTGIIILWNYNKIKSYFGIIASTILILSGVMVHRFLLLPAAFNSIPLSFIPFGVQNKYWSVPISSGIYQEGKNTFVTWWDYFPSLTEFSIFLGVVALMIFIVLITMTFVSNNKNS